MRRIPPLCAISAHEVYARMFGVVNRFSGHLRVAPLEQKLTPASARPPVEGREEVLNTQLLQSLPVGSHVATDTAHSFRKIIKKDLKSMRLKHFCVNHRKSEYSRTLEGGQGDMKIAGTQQLDALWGHLKRWRPVGLKKKDNKTKRCTEDMYSWAFSYTFRHNISSEMDKWSLFAKALWRR